MEKDTLRLKQGITETSFCIIYLLSMGVTSEMPGTNERQLRRDMLEIEKMLD